MHTHTYSHAHKPHACTSYIYLNSHICTHAHTYRTRIYARTYAPTTHTYPPTPPHAHTFAQAATCTHARACSHTRTHASMHVRTFPTLIEESTFSVCLDWHCSVLSFYLSTRCSEPHSHWNRQITTVGKLSIHRQTRAVTVGHDGPSCRRRQSQHPFPTLTNTATW